MQQTFRYHHLGIPTKTPMQGEVYLKDYKFYLLGFDKSEFRLEWIRYEEDCPFPDIIKTIPHIAFEVDNIYEAMKGRKILIEPNSPVEGLIVAFIEENGTPIEFVQLIK